MLYINTRFTYWLTYLLPLSRMYYDYFCHCFPVVHFPVCHFPATRSDRVIDDESGEEWRWPRWRARNEMNQNKSNYAEADRKLISREDMNYIETVISYFQTGADGNSRWRDSTANGRRHQGIRVPDICHTVGDISTSGLDGHIAISGCPSISRIYLWTLSLSLVWSKTLLNNGNNFGDNTEETWACTQYVR